ncbi:MAG: hypothetical protein KIT10_16160 [Flavobacteriales bacterium]|nr:hypothetical protein [Flavobacteriales bacterium]
MRSTILLLLAFVQTLGSWAQGTTQKVSYILKDKTTNLTVYADAQGKPDFNKPRVLDGWLLFNKVNDKHIVSVPADKKGTYIKIQIPGRSCSQRSGLDLVKYCGNCKDHPSDRITACDYGMAFWVLSDLIRSADDFDTEEGKKNAPVAPVYNTRSWDINVGVVSLAGKIRPERGRLPTMLDTDVNLGSSISFRRRLHGTRDYHLSFALTTGYQSTRMTSYNNTSIDGDGVESVSSMINGLGLVLDFDRVQLCGFAGMDTAFGRLSKHYEYQGTPWFGLALGLNILKDADRNALPDLGGPMSKIQNL